MIETILAQVAPELPNVKWWQEYGPLGIIGLIVASGIITYMWVLHFPHAKAVQQQDLKHRQKKQELETEREEKLNGFIDKISESYGAEVEFKRQMAVAVTEVAKTQQSHASDCAHTKRAIEMFGDKLEHILDRITNS